MYKCRCLFIFILKADVPRFNCDISLYMPKTIVSVVKKTKLSLLFYLWCNWCITRKCVFDVYLFICRYTYVC